MAFTAATPLVAISIGPGEGGEAREAVGDAEPWWWRRW